MSYDVKLRDVACLSDHTHFEVPRNELGARRGPFPYYGDLFERFEIDDYGLNAPSVIFMAAAGKVVDPCGFRVAMEHGRCGSNAFAHVLVPHDHLDGDYIHACLAHHPHAVDYIGGANQLQTLDELAVLRIALPWPDRPVRDAFVRHVADIDARIGSLRRARSTAVESGASNADVLVLEASLYEQAQARDILIGDFMDFGVLRDMDCTPSAPHFTSVPVPYSDARAERARLELAEEAREEACRRGGIPLDPRLVDALGPLSSIVAHDTDGLAAQDVAWELGPLAVMRACLPQEAWENLVAASGSRDGLVAALDSLMASLAVENPLLSLLPNLSYESSVLDFERLSRWCASLGAVASTDIASGHIRAVFDLAAGAQAVPAEVGRLVASVAASHLEKGSAAATPRFYLPCAAADCLSDIPASVDARADCSCQCCDTEALIQACLVRAVAARPTPDAGMLVGVARGHSALLEDAFAAERADVVLCEVCDPFVPWAEKPPRRDDPRWSVGVPTRMRPTFAWLEHCLFHSAPGGISINLIPTSELETHKPVDSEILSRLALEGHVAAAAVLPARIWGDGRPPMSLVVLRGQASAAPCLMVDASCLGKQRSDLAPLLPNPQRCFGGPAFEGVCALLSTWFAEGRLLEVADIPARLVAPQELLAAGGSISPWTYLSAGQHQNAC